MYIPQKNLLSYKLLDDGSIFKIPNEDLSSFFINVNIISVYFYKEKRLYIWKGENVPRNLQNHIPLIEEQILRLNPDITILRHFTVEGVKEETIELLGLLRINQEDFKKQLEEWDNFRERMLSSIEILQNEIKEHYTNNEFREIQTKANDIIDIAEKLQEIDIISEHERIIQEVIKKLDVGAEEDIKSKLEPLKQKFEDFEKSNQFEDARKILKEINEILEKTQDRGLQRYWTNIKIKLKQKEEEYEVQQSLNKKEENQRKYEIMIEKIKGNELNHEWNEGYENCQEIFALLKGLEKFEELKEYNHKSYFFEKQIEKEETEKTSITEQKPKVEAEVEPLKEEEPVKEEKTQVKEKEELVMEEETQVKEEETLVKEEEELVKEEEELVKEEEEKPVKEEEEKPVKEEEELVEEEEEELVEEEEEKPVKEEKKIEENKKDFIDKLEIADYNLLLRKANLIESRSPNETKQILKKCLTIITKNREEFIEKNPKRSKDETILEKRV